MNPCLPYGWQAKGETVGIVPQGNQKINVFGIFNSANFGFTKFSDQNINADFIASAIEDFAQKLTPEKTSVLVLDNAATHHNLLFRAKSANWQEKGLFVFYLPKYSPHLNLAETFWRKAKYELEFALPFSEGLSKVRLRNEEGFVDKSGRIVIPLKYELATPFEKGLAKVRLKGEWFYIAKDGTEYYEP